MQTRIANLARRPGLLLLLPVVVYLSAFFLIPFLWLLRVSLARNRGGTGYGEGKAFYEPGTWTLDNYLQFLTDKFFLNITLFTVELGLMVAVISTVVSYALAYQIWRAPAWLKGPLVLMVILPKFTNVIVLMFGLLVVFGSRGLLNSALINLGMIAEPVPMMFNLFSVLLGETILVMPYCVLIILAALMSIDRALLDAAGGLGATRFKAFIEVTLPLTLPAISVSMVLSFMWGAAAFAAPYLLGKPDLYTLAVEVDRQVNWRLNWAMGSAIAIILTGIIAACLFFYFRQSPAEERR